MMARPINRSKKSNIKCEHCENWILPQGIPHSAWDYICRLSGEPKNYWSKCKKFEWRKDREYIDSEKKSGEEE